MARKLVVCCDGTWNDEKDGSNIRHTYERLRNDQVSPSSRDDKEEGWETSRSDRASLYYDTGVGTRWWDRVVGGGLGAGLSRNVCQAYKFLCREYREGDQIYIFGFSRGAYTARSLGGFIAAVGGLLPPDVTAATVAQTYLERYVAQDNLLGTAGRPADGAAHAALAEDLGVSAGSPAAAAGATRSVKIRFLGVYDTVGSLGVPTPILGLLARPVVRFHNTSLGSLIEHAVHALAVDERRVPFSPTLWTMPPSGSLAAGQTCLQTWFPGVHSDVGGGYADGGPGRGIADITFDFMMRQAAQRGLVLNPESLVQPHAWGGRPLDDLPPQHDSFSRWSRRFSTVFARSTEGAPRPIGDAQRADGKPVAKLEMLHPSLVRRWGRTVRTMVEEGSSGDGVYAPASFSWPADVAKRRPTDVPVFVERLDGIRLPVDQEARLDGRPCLMLDHSPGGARIRADSAMTVGKKVRLGDRQGVVVWAKGREAGVKLAA